MRRSLSAAAIAGCRTIKGPVVSRAGSAPYRHQSISRHLEFHRGLFDGGSLVSGLDRAKPEGFARELVDVPDDGLRRFGLLCHAGSIGRLLSTSNSDHGHEKGTRRMTGT
jgi:hypothetical protein